MEKLLVDRSTNLRDFDGLYDRAQVGPNDGLRKGILTGSKTHHNSRSRNENRTYIGQKDGIEEGPDDSNRRNEQRIERSIRLTYGSEIDWNKERERITIARANQDSKSEARQRDRLIGTLEQYTINYL